jgi:hypothetical protein
LYGFDTLGKIIRTLTISNATNEDWEDIACDTHGNLYLGDSGINTNARTNLRIYKIPAPASIPGNTVSAGIFEFSYPATGNQNNVDTETMIFFNDSLYLFSKNHTAPFNGYTRMYRLPAWPGTYTAALVDSFYTGTDAVAGQITAAAVSPDGSRLALLSYTKLYVFSGFTGSRFFKGQLTRLDVDNLSQKEGICFADNCTVYITDEEFLFTGRRLYRVNVCPVTTGLNNLHPDPEIKIGALYPNPAQADVAMQYRLPALVQPARLLVYNLYGYEVSRTWLNSSAEIVTLPVAGWPAGVYYCRIETYTSAGNVYKPAIVW